ncbi:hypothetical protein SNE40_021711 [Patella caerulea]|uniref:L-Fucosyltransferase n=1 Tax=Patella caerulea TaxID=87958 RepID=A0AAN8J4C3_PATCE
MRCNTWRVLWVILFIAVTGLFVIQLTYTIKPYSLYHTGTNTNNTGKYSHRLFLCHKFHGGLGNLLYKFASAYAIARENNMELVSVKDEGLSAALEYPPEMLQDNGYCGHLPVLKENKCCSYDPKFLNINRSVNVDGYLQSWIYFQKYSDDLRQLIIFKEDQVEQAKKLLDEELGRRYDQTSKLFRTLVGMHIRRGNKLEAYYVKYGYKVAPAHYIVRAMKYFSDRFQNLTFVVVTEDQKWAMDNIPENNDVIFMKKNDAVVDMIILTLMNHTIMTVGTFGWWAAWLTDGTTVYYKDFVEPYTKFGQQHRLDHSDHILPGWIPL